MSAIDPKPIAATLTGRFGLDVVPAEVSVDGGRWPAVRPAFPPEPNGFAVALSATPRRATATFQPDRFAGQLMTAIAQSDESARAAAEGLATSASQMGMSLLATLDEKPLSDPSDFRGEWGRIDIECTMRIFPRKSLPEHPMVAVAAACMGLVLALLPLEEEMRTIEPGLPEGALIRTVVNRYERSPVNRLLCIDHFGARCQACDFDFGRMYGSLGSGYIQVHHTKMVSEMGGSYLVDPRKDLVPLCANCHAMVHRRTPPLTVSELRQVLGQTTKATPVQGPGMHQSDHNYHD